MHELELLKLRMRALELAMKLIEHEGQHSSLATEAAIDPAESSVGGDREAVHDPEDGA